MERWMSPMSATPYQKTTNEPKVHPLLRKSFVFVPSAGMRLAPEILVMELMREVFFEPHYGAIATKTLNAEETDDERRHCFSVGERAVLHALRGRRKQSTNSRPDPFFAPAYPQLAKGGWLGKKRERVVNGFLLSGPIAQHLWHKGSGTEDGKRRQADLVEKVRQALVGHRSCLGDTLDGTDVLAATLGRASFNADGDLATRKLTEQTGQTDSVIGVDENDELADRVTQDLLAICDLEAGLPRMQWVQLFMTFLRFALPMWLLAQMQITRLLHAWLLAAADNRRIADMQEVLRGLASRNRGLLHPTLTPTRELFEHIERYMKCRVEVDILLYCLEEVRKNQISGKALTLGKSGRDVISMAKLLSLVAEASRDIRNTDRFREVADGCDVRTFLTREGEQFPAWRNPRRHGQGKNIDEFFRVLYRAHLGDEAGGYLLVSEGRGAKRGFRVFPGQLLLKTVMCVAAKGKWSGQPQGGTGKLVLQDVEEHFGQYGIDFSTAADARPLLMKGIQAMGLLTGSPDAGSSVAVACPY
jgi:hypothetical protein